MIKNLIILALLITVTVLFFSLINYDEFQRFSYPILINIEKSLDFMIAKGEIVEELLFPLKMYISEIIEKLRRNIKLRNLYIEPSQAQDEKQKFMLPYRDTLTPISQVIQEGKYTPSPESSPTEIKTNEEKYVLLTLHNNFKVKGKLISEKKGNYTIELDGLPVEFSSTEINSVRNLSHQEYLSLINIVADKSSQDDQLQ